MAWKKAGLLALSLWLSACSTFLGDHPFSSLPKASGKLDKTPEVLVLRGQHYTVCSTGPNQTLYFFIHLRWMSAREVWVWSGEAKAKPAKPGRLFGTSMEVKMSIKNQPGWVSWHQLNLEVDGVVRSYLTTVVDCKFVSAVPEWRSGDIVSGAAADAAGS